jgi:prepilin-type N-terminal cleavage/methylation domain-containing protein
MRKAFTLIEVMIAVVIISVVIAALIQMFANNTHIFSSLKSQSKINSYVSLFIANDTYGLEDREVSLDDLVSEFNVESELRAVLRETKAKIIYKELESIDMREYEEGEEVDQESEASVNSGLVFEVGSSTIKIHDSSASLLRIQIQ